MAGGTARVEKTDITAALVARMVAEQFPQWSGLPVTSVELDGWDNTTFRLGSGLSVRLPRGDGYVPQIAKEHRWLPVLAPQLPLPIPQPLVMGAPGSGFPRPWSVYRWLAGEHATVDRISDLSAVATDLAGFLTASYAIDATGGPPPDAHNGYRGGPLGTYDDETRAAIVELADEIDAGVATAMWEAALAATWNEPPVWLHGDVAPSNLLVVDGALSAVIDFGCTAVGDPACDLTVAWTFFEGPSRRVFRDRLGPPADVWQRTQGWLLWKALLTVNDDAGALRMGWRHGHDTSWPTCSASPDLCLGGNRPRIHVDSRPDVGGFRLRS